MKTEAGSAPEGSSDASSSSDVRLVARSKAGDTAAFNELVTKYRNRVYGTTYNLVRNEQDAWDLTQDAFLKAWRNLDRFKGDSSFFTWLYRIATNVSLDWLRRKQIESGVEFDETLGVKIEPSATTAPKPEAAPHRRLEGAEIRSQIDAAIGQLSAEHRTVILLREVENLAYEDIAQAMGTSVGTVMSRLFYARKKLQALLREFYDTL